MTIYKRLQKTDFVFMVHQPELDHLMPKNHK